MSQEQMDLFTGTDDLDLLPPVLRTFWQCEAGKHDRCVRAFPGCGWDGHKSNPAPMHRCICHCHKENQR